MAKRIRIVPAILTEDPAELEKMVRLTETFTDFVQMDIMDGKFVPSNSVSVNHIAALKTRLSWEAHLMVLHPEDYLDDFRRAGARKIVFHFESTPTPRIVIRMIQRLGMQAGLAINPETPIDKFSNLIKQLDSVLFLSVNPGFYGAKFIPEVLDKITSLRQDAPNIEIGIDGGIKENNVAMIAQTGVNVICVGSAIYKQPDPGTSYRRLKQLAEKNVPK
jgi:ribulose-phosphate 3-epimerase